MERFHGIFICTTNLMDRVDQAALRRFTFKIRFLPLTRVQRVALFVAEACAGDATRLEQAMEKRLASLDQLCVGDFAAVKRQAAILDTAVDPAEFLEQLEAEHRIKPEVRDARAMGFMP
jgi:SpoVK/Ycf46/Vps4 family AAA+-type ATPase